MILFKKKTTNLHSTQSFTYQKQIIRPIFCVALFKMTNVDLHKNREKEGTHVFHCFPLRRNANQPTKKKIGVSEAIMNKTPVGTQNHTGLKFYVPISF